MKLNEKSCAIGLLLGDKTASIRVSKNSVEFKEAVTLLENDFPAMRPLFRQSIQYFCKPFFDAYIKAKEKLLEVLKNEPIRQSGTFICSREVGYTTTIFY